MIRRCACRIQAISSLDAREIVFIVLEQLPDVTNLNQDTFQVCWHFLMASGTIQWPLLVLLATELPRSAVANAGDLFTRVWGCCSWEGTDRPPAGFGVEPFHKMVSTNLSIQDGLSRHMSIWRVSLTVSTSCLWSSFCAVWGMIFGGWKVKMRASPAQCVCHDRAIIQFHNSVRSFLHVIYSRYGRGSLREHSQSSDLPSGTPFLNMSVLLPTNTVSSIVSRLIILTFSLMPLVLFWLNCYWL